MFQRLSTGRRLLAITIPLALLVSGCVSPIGRDDAVSASTIPDDQRPLKEFHLYVHENTVFSPHEGKLISALAFSTEPNTPGTVPGPEIRVTEGDRVRVTLHQQGGLPHTIHWHGISLPWEMDGVPFMTQDVAHEPSTYVYEFNADETGTYWYHCHVDAPTHIDAGLLGAFIVEPRNPAQDPPFDREYTLILHETDSTWFLNNPVLMGRDPTEYAGPENPAEAPDYALRTTRDAADFAGAISGAYTGNHLFSEGPRDYYGDFSLRYHPYYDTFMINGKSFPETTPLLTKTGENVRIRLVNGGQLLHTMHLHGHHFLVTHKDGYPLPEGARYYADSLVIGPGERYDVYVKANNPGIWDFHDHGGMFELGSYAANDHAFPGGMSTMLVYEDFKYAKLRAPEPGRGHTSGDYMVWAKSYKGLNPPPGGLHGAHHHAVHGTPAPAPTTPEPERTRDDWSRAPTAHEKGGHALK